MKLCLVGDSSQNINVLLSPQAFLAGWILSASKGLGMNGETNPVSSPTPASRLLSGSMGTTPRGAGQQSGLPNLP